MSLTTLSGKLCSRIASLIGLRMRHAQEHYAQQLQPLIPHNGRWLDIGCGTYLFPSWLYSNERQQNFVPNNCQLIGIDLDRSLEQNSLCSLRAYANAEKLPFADDTFDLVSANMVFEHLQNPPVVFSEIKRVLRPNGKFILHTPNRRNYLVFLARLCPDYLKKKIVWLLERREANEVFPTFYRANSYKDLLRLSKQTDLQPISIDYYGSLGTFWRLLVVAQAEVLILRLLQTQLLSPFNSVLIASFEKQS